MQLKQRVDEEGGGAGRHSKVIARLLHTDGLRCGLCFHRQISQNSAGLMV